MSDDSSRKKKFIEIMKAIAQGAFQGGICAGIGILLSLINPYAIFAVVAIWLILGWLTPYLIKTRALEILVVILSGSIISFIIYYFSGLQLWLIPLLIGVSILFWTISLTTKIILFPKKETIAENES
ncbi:MAG: hypothetical protein FK733_08690 [Asgard group archaeon]|nr:hypothetical protein [Asgard group archaeon]